MFKIIRFILPTLIFILLLLTPDIVLEGAKSGLSLWFNALIPALLPYMLFSNLVINAGLTNGMEKIALPITKLLKISPSASFGIIAGLFFGYPACAANLSLLVKNKQLDKSTAAFCVCAFNNISPAYIIGFVCMGLLNKPKLTIIVLSIFYISLLLSTIIIRVFIFRKLVSSNLPSKKTNIPSKGYFNTSIKNSLVNIGLLGGYVIIFSIILTYLKKFPYITPFIEIAGGCINICQLNIPIKTILLILLPALSFGGISGIFQTLAVDTEQFIDIKKYIYSKILSGIICLIVTFLTVYVLKIPV